MKTVIKNAKILTMAGLDYECGCIVMENGKLVAVGEPIPALLDGADEVIDASGLWALPGFIDSHCHIGLFNDGMGEEGEDGNEAIDPVTPHLRAIDSIDPQDICFTEARMHGVTTVVTGPGSANVIGGQFSALKTKKSNLVEDMAFVPVHSLKVAFGENPKRVYSSQKRAPTTRMATAAILREELIKALDYKRKWELGLKDPDKMIDRDIRKEVLVMALNREIPVKAHAHRTDDILTALRIGREFNLNMTIEHATEGYMILDDLKRFNAQCILGPLLCDRGKVELKNLSIKAPVLYANAGLKFALMTDHPVNQSYTLPFVAAICVREGLSETDALKAITIHAAEITGLQNRVGSLEVGKDADVLLFNGNPMDVRNQLVATFIDGEFVKA